ncbi:hypothetical protein R3P38DRAFT_2618548 [Favolaschia claudopus]|uniref:Uncharacterized protein n=1 Tax=Favolaschia claudopus TaxID=2862362 RepID=A0AAW0C314_9AGAR
MLAALRKTSLQDAEVDFSGSYVVSGNDTDTTSDKQRVQNVINDVWKATGYRFTVKDHPPTENGHKTRLWCSQDEARRSKHRGGSDPPRMSKQGELFAKQRFPCRSRLMITCLPSSDWMDSTGTERKIVTVRMHHHMRHEFYRDGAAESNTTNRSTAEAPQPTPQPTQVIPAPFHDAITTPLPPALMAIDVGHSDIELPRSMPIAPPPALHDQEGEWDTQAVPASPSPSPHFVPATPPIDSTLAKSVPLRTAPPLPPQPRSQPPSSMPQALVPTPSQHSLPSQSPHPVTALQRRASAQLPPPVQHAPTSTLHPPPTQHPSLPAPPQPSMQPPHPHPHPLPHSHPHPQPTATQLTPEEFQHRMRTHIARIRDFCDGLEYQVQFNDYRMLEALERDAAPFIDFLQDCLRREGRMG